MATIGDVLPSPEGGWKRYSNTDPAIRYVGTSWEFISGVHLTYKASDSIRFSFTGDKIRIIGVWATTWIAKFVSITIDGVEYIYDQSIGVVSNNTLFFEKVGLDNKEHLVIITGTSSVVVGSTNFNFVAVDVADTGRVYSFWPTGTKTTVGAMKMGDRIPFNYKATSNSFGIISQLGTSTAPEIPITSSATPDGTAYFIMVGYDSRGRNKLVADRNLQHSISWDTLNTAGVASGSGLPITIDGIEGYTLRLLSGGVSSTDKDNEWDKIIVESDLGGTIVPGDNSVWNWGVNTVASICSTRIGNTLSRGYATPGSRYGTTPTGNATATEGFRTALLVESKNIYPLILKDNKAYSFSNNTFQEVTSDWNSLTSTEKQALFTSTDFPPVSVLKDLINFTILTFSEEDISLKVAITSIPFKTTLPSAYSPTITAIPKPQFVHASGDIDLSGATNIDWIHINNGIANSVTGDSVLKYVFSTDKGVTWKTYNGSEFVDALDTANTNDGNIVAGRFIPSTAAMTRLLQNGMTKAVFDAAPWNDTTLAVNNKLIRFATIFDLASITDNCFNDNLVYQYDGISVWRQAINGTDYTVRFTSPSKMEVKFLTGGYKAKVNY
jgi:hypothetical protein